MKPWVRTWVVETLRLVRPVPHVRRDLNAERMLRRNGCFVRRVAYTGSEHEPRWSEAGVWSSELSHSCTLVYCKYQILGTPLRPKWNCDIPAEQARPKRLGRYLLRNCCRHSCGLQYVGLGLESYLLGQSYMRTLVMFCRSDLYCYPHSLILAYSSPLIKEHIYKLMRFPGYLYVCLCFPFSIFKKFNRFLRHLQWKLNFSYRLLW